MKKIIITLATIATLLIGLQIYAEYSYASWNRQLLQMWSHLGRDGAADHETLREILNQPEVFPQKHTLAMFGPATYFQQARLNQKEECLLYLSQNLGLPEASRFADVRLNGIIGIDPAQRTDDDVVAYTKSYLLDTR